MSDRTEVLYNHYITIVLFLNIRILASQIGLGDAIVGFTTTCAISAYHHYNYEFQSRSM